MMRINKFLAKAGAGSRRAVEDLVSAGKITVNGVVCRDLSTQIDETKDEVIYNGKILKADESKIYLMLNKPRGCITSKKDEQGRPTVYELLPNKGENLFSVGRLDFNSEGLLIFTNDGDFANSIIHPRYKIEKYYEVLVEGVPSENELQKLRDGVEIEGGLTAPAKVRLINKTIKETLIEIIIQEGRKRQIRQMIEAINYKVIKLKRVRLGAVKLGDLPLGKYRELTQAEYFGLMKLVSGGLIKK